ncbi:hypothetical protein LJR219_004164 [Phenylobacterium sp. LjRoot219]|uniref:hypothetical protein n=1 Tax=Phenylobacterium sp. LjRoot219 TaxID=3342283 RepID=UPI003ECF728D
MSQIEKHRSVGVDSNNRFPVPTHMPWYVTRLLDRRALRLNIKGAGEVARSLELERFLVDRAGDARDLFALRGVRTRRSTVFQLMSRSISADAAANDNGAPAGRPVRADAASLVPAALLTALR